MSFERSEMLPRDPGLQRVPAGVERGDTSLRHRSAIERVIGAMRGRLEGDFTLKDMADTASMSRFHFSRVFRRLTGVPPLLFLSAVRLQTAKRLLLTTQLNVTDICFDVGYNSLGTFIRRFTNMVGVPPGRLRSQARAMRCWPARAPAHVASATHVAVNGRVFSDAPTYGPIFVGLFATPIPQGRPVGCAVLTSPGPYAIDVLPRRQDLYLFATAHTRSRDPAAYLLCDAALRGGGQALRVEADHVRGATDVRLRPAAPTDPPILLALPLLDASEPEGVELG